MVHASMHMEYVSMRGWAIGHGSISDLPLCTTPAGHRPQPDLPHLPYQNCGEGDHQVGSLASPGETSRHSPHQSQEIQDSWAQTSNQKQKAQWSNHADLPLPGALHHLQSWLLSGGVSLAFFDADFCSGSVWELSWGAKSLLTASAESVGNPLNHSLASKYKFVLWDDGISTYLFLPASCPLLARFLPKTNLLGRPYPVDCAEDK